MIIVFLLSNCFAVRCYTARPPSEACVRRVASQYLYCKQAICRAFRGSDILVGYLRDDSSTAMRSLYMAMHGDKNFRVAARCEVCLAEAMIGSEPGCCGRHGSLRLGTVAGWGIVIGQAR